MVRDALSGGEDTLPLTEAQTLAWLRAFNHLRVAAGEILGIEGDGWEDTATDATKQKPEYGVLIALGYLQEELVAALDSVTGLRFGGRVERVAPPVDGLIDADRVGLQSIVGRAPHRCTRRCRRRRCSSRSMSVATHQLWSSGHQRLALVGPAPVPRMPTPPRSAGRVAGPSSAAASRSAAPLPESDQARRRIPPTRRTSISKALR